MTDTPASTPRRKPKGPHQNPRQTLNQREADFVAALANGRTGTEAAIAAGAPRGTAPQSASRMKRRPIVQAAIARIQEQLRTVAVYDAATAMAEMRQGQEFALVTENANAFVRASEMRARLTGLLVEKSEVKVRTIDLAGAIALARARSRLPPIAGEFLVVDPNAPQLAEPTDSESVDIFS